MINDIKQKAQDFLNLVMQCKFEEAYEKYVDMNGKHHNVYFPSGFEILKKAMIESHKKFKNTTISIKQVIAEGNLVAVHSHVILEPGTPGVAVVHIFRFNNGKIVEMWDVGQQLPEDNPNSDGAFS